MIRNVLFDLDGTLLPMDMDVFQKGYFGCITKELIPFGYHPKQSYAGIMSGVECMMKNDGSVTNEAAFWKGFVGAMGEAVLAVREPMDAFYRDKFGDLKVFCGFNPAAAQTVRRLKEHGYRVVVATNPLFPRTAIEHRIRWTGLEPKDFELVTCYEESHFCKPNPGYFTEIAERLGMDPAECLMVGNDAVEDAAAEQAGMQVFMLTDCMLNKNNVDISRYPQGGFAELNAFLKLD